jgi:tetratricopeptide (TPR) repeat protein
LKLVDSVLAVYPGTRVALRDRASFLHRLGKSKESLQAYEVALKNCDGCPEESRLRQDRVIVASDAGQHDVAVAEARELVRKEPEGVGLHLLLGNVLAAKGDTAGARRAYNDEARIFPSDPAPLLAMARMATEHGKPQEAEAVYRRAIAANPNSSEAQLALSGFLVDAKRLEEAEGIIGKLLVTQPDNAAANSQMGFICSATKRPDLAIEYYGRSLKARPNHAGTLANLGAVFLNTGKKDKAFEVLKACVGTGQAPQAAFANLGICFAERGELDTAIQVWEKGLSLDPNSQVANALKQNLTRAQTMKQQGKTAQPGTGK